MLPSATGCAANSCVTAWSVSSRSGRASLPALSRTCCPRRQGRRASPVLTANVGLPHRSIREAIALAVHLIVHVARVQSRRCVTELVAVNAYDGPQDRFMLEPCLASEAREGVQV